MTSVNSLDTVDVLVLNTILQNLVTAPEEIKIDRKIDEQGVVLSVTVSAKDMGLVIGRGGSMASTIKVLMRAVGKANKMIIRVEFREPDGSIRYSARNNKEYGEENQEPSIQSEDTLTITHSNLDEDIKDFMVD